MPPKRRRYGTRSQSSQSQSQSQSQQSPISQFSPPPQLRSRPAVRPPHPPPAESQPESFFSLPPHNAVSVASHRPVTEDEETWAVKEGVDYLADCKRLDAELLDLVPIPRGVGRLDGPRKDKGKGKAKDGYWRTATLAYACTCNLPLYPQGWISHPPPLNLGSGQLEVPDWSTDLCEDADPSLDALEEFDAQWHSPPSLAPPPHPALTQLRSSSPAGPSRSSSLPAATQRPAPSASARRRWWRDLITADPRFGRMDTVLRPEYPTPYAPTPPARAGDEWKPPKLAGKRHPFHPDVARYCRRSGARVHWVVPVHGPVVLPGWGDPVSGGRTPFTSRGELDEDGKRREDEGERRDKARPVLWTPALLADFVAALVEVQHDGRYGRLRIAPSGPKPDPFLPAPRSVVPPSHSLLPKRRRPKSSEESELFTPEDPVPVGVECGDHLRVYVDAHKALSFRTWLAHWNGGLFAKCRFALVAPSGECLIVA